MNSKHAVQHRKHHTHAVTHGKHATQAVQARKRTTEMLRPFESLGTVFEDLLDLPMAGDTAVNMPAVDIRETDKTIEVSVALSGVEKKDIHLDLTEDSLAISCERREASTERGAGGYQLQEQSYGRFYRAFTLPAAINTGDSKAAYTNGVLRITMQKQKPYRTTQIAVE